jgi:hypothetical protein
VYRRLHGILVNLRLDYLYLEYVLFWALWVIIIERSVFILYTAFKILDACVDHVIEAFKNCLKTYWVGLNKPLSLVLLAHVSILISAIYHIVFYSHSTWIGPIIEQLYFFNEFPMIVHIVYPQREEYEWDVSEILYNWVLILDLNVYTGRVPLTKFPYLAPYEYINNRHEVYSSTHFLSQEASLRPYSQEPADRILYRRRSFFKTDVDWYVRNTYRTYNSYFQLDNSHIPNPVNCHYPFRPVHYPMVSGNYKVLDYMIYRSTTQVCGSWDPAVIEYLRSVRDVIAWEAKGLTLREVANFGNFCEIVHGYKAGVFEETVYSDIRFPLRRL